MGHYRWKTLPWRWRWGLWQIYCRVGIGWRWWAGVPPLCARTPRSCLPTSSSLHLFVLCFNLRIACQEQSSAAIPLHNSAPRNTERRQLETYWLHKVRAVFFLSPHFIYFFIELWRIYGSDLIWCITFGGALVLRVSDIVQHLSVCLFGELAGSRACWDAARLLITALTLQRKIWWLKFIFDTVIIKLLKTIKRLPISPVLVSLCLSPPF